MEDPTVHLVLNEEDSVFVCGKDKGKFTTKQDAVTCAKCFDTVKGGHSPAVDQVFRDKLEPVQKVLSSTESINDHVPVPAMGKAVKPSHKAKPPVKKVAPKKAVVHQMPTPKKAAPAPPTPAVAKRAKDLAAVKKDRPPCLCGCGGFPSSPKGKYLPGHDAKHHAALKAEMQGNKTETKHGNKKA